MHGQDPPVSRTEGYDALVPRLQGHGPPCSGLRALVSEGKATTLTNTNMKQPPVIKALSALNRYYHAARGVGNTTAILVAAHTGPNITQVVFNSGKDIEFFMRDTEGKSLMMADGQAILFDREAIKPISLANDVHYDHQKPLVIDNHAMMNILQETLNYIAQLEHAVGVAQAAAIQISRACA